MNGQQYPQSAIDKLNARIAELEAAGPGAASGGEGVEVAVAKARIAQLEKMLAQRDAEIAALRDSTEAALKGASSAASAPAEKRDPEVSHKRSR